MKEKRKTQNSIKRVKEKRLKKKKIIQKVRIKGKKIKKIKMLIHLSSFSSHFIWTPGIPKSEKKYYENVIYYVKTLIHILNNTLRYLLVLIILFSFLPKKTKPVITLVMKFFVSYPSNITLKNNPLFLFFFYLIRFPNS